MSKCRQHFATHGHTGMRLAGLPGTCTASPCCHAGRAVAGFARVSGFASVLRPVLGWYCTPSDKLPQLPQLGLKKSGQRKPNNGGLPQLPRLAPPVFDMNRNATEAARRVWCAGRELTSRHKIELCNATVQLNGSSLGFPPAGNPNRMFPLDCVPGNYVNSLHPALQMVSFNAKR